MEMSKNVQAPVNSQYNQEDNKTCANSSWFWIAIVIAGIFIALAFVLYIKK